MKHIVLEHVDVVKIHVLEENELETFHTSNHCDYLTEDNTDKELWNKLVKMNDKLFSWEVEV